jgi:hypothetical protein
MTIISGQPREELFMSLRGWLSLALTIPICLAHHGQAQASSVVVNHVTDGVFGANEWNGPNVVTTFFPLVGNAGGAALYVDQGSPAVLPALFAVQSPTTLYLGYDIYSNPAGATAPTSASFFDVFFQVASEHNDYDARIHQNGTVELFQKPTGSVGPVTANGSLDVSKSPWTAADSTDILRAGAVGAIGFGPTPNNSNNHVFVEFQLNINNSLGGRQGGDPSNPDNNGLYDPSAAFWSGSGKPGGTDPPITSGIFSLNPDGTTSVTPALGLDGAPLLQPLVTPEPSTFVLAGLGAFCMAGLTWRRKKVAVVAS